MAKQQAKAKSKNQPVSGDNALTSADSVPGKHELVGTEIECTQHQGYMLLIQQEGTLLFAVCNCAVRNNMWKGQRVWERGLTESELASITMIEPEPAPSVSDGGDIYNG